MRVPTGPVGKMLELLEYRSNKHVTDATVAAGCGSVDGMILSWMTTGTWIEPCPPSDRQPQDPGKVGDAMVHQRPALVHVVVVHDRVPVTRPACGNTCWGSAPLYFKRRESALL